MGLNDLPTEILFEIAGYLPHPAIKGLVKTNRRLYYCFNKTLYRGDAQTGKSHALAYAARNGILNTARKAIQAKTNLDVFDSGSRPLHEAVRRNHFDVVKLLLEAGADTKQASQLVKGTCPKYFTEELCLNCNRPSRATSQDSMLDIATQNESLDVMEILLKHGLNVNRINGWKKTPLLIAIECNNPAAMKLLIAYGADVELRTTYTPLVCTASKDQEASQILVENGAQVFTEDGLPCELLLEAVRHANRYLVDLIFEGDIDIRHNGGPHAATGRAALRTAITKHRYELFHLLLEKGADPTYPASGGDRYSPLWMTIQIKARDNLNTWVKGMVRDLLEKGCNPNEQETNHWTPLAMAVESQDYDIVKMLLEKGANPNIGSFLHDPTNSPSKCTPLAQALRKRNEAVAQLLIHHGADPKIQPRRDQYLLVKAVSLGMPRCCIEKMLQMGVNVNSKSPSEETALSLAVMEGDEYLTRTLLNYGANPNSTKQSLSVLSWAFRKKHLGVAKILREHGAMEFAR